MPLAFGEHVGTLTKVVGKVMLWLFRIRERLRYRSSRAYRLHRHKPRATLGTGFEFYMSSLDKPLVVGRRRRRLPRMLMGFLGIVGIGFLLAAAVWLIVESVRALSTM